MRNAKSSVMDVCNSNNSNWKFDIFAVTVTMVSRYHGYLRGNFLDRNGINIFRFKWERNNAISLETAKMGM